MSATRNGPTIPATVEVPGELLVEAAGYVDALDTIANNLGVELGKDPEQTSSTRALALVCELATAAGLYDALEGLPDEEHDAAYDTHPVNVAIEEHSSRVVGAFRPLYDDDALAMARALLDAQEGKLTTILARLDEVEARIKAREATT